MQEFGGEKRDSQFVMPGEGVAVTGAIRYGAADDVCQRAIGLNEIEIGGRDVCQCVSEIAYQRDGFEKNFGKHDCRADVQINSAAVHASDHLGKQAKIRVRRFAKSRAVPRWMKGRDVRATRDVSGE